MEKPETMPLTQRKFYVKDENETNREKKLEMGKRFDSLQVLQFSWH